MTCCLNGWETEDSEIGNTQDFRQIDNRTKIQGHFSPKEWGIKRDRHGPISGVQGTGQRIRIGSETPY